MFVSTVVESIVLDSSKQSGQSHYLYTRIAHLRTELNLNSGLVLIYVVSFVYFSHFERSPTWEEGLFTGQSVLVKSGVRRMWVYWIACRHRHTCCVSHKVRYLRRNGGHVAADLFCLL